jgi:hypothetical protein
VALVSKVTFNKDVISQKIKTEITRADGNKINAQVSESIRKISDRMVGVGAGQSTSSVAQTVKHLAAEEMAAGLLSVNALLKTGIAGGDSGNAGFGFQPLSKGWLRKKKPVNRDKFWKNTGNLAFGFGPFAHGYIAQLRSAKTVVKARSRSRTFGKKMFSYEISVQLPAHREPFITEITRNSFIRATPYIGVGSSSEDLSSARPRTFGKIGLLEGTGKYHRPFIAKIMASRGRNYQRMVNQVIRNLVLKA